MDASSGEYVSEIGGGGGVAESVMGAPFCDPTKRRKFGACGSMLDECVLVQNKKRTAPSRLAACNPEGQDL